MKDKIKILYVDDEPINLQLFDINFSDIHNVTLAEDGFKGLEILEKDPEINYVISDMKMPGMNGMEFINKAHNNNPDCKYYILSGFEITSEIQEAVNSGRIIKYFRKPCNMEIIGKEFV